MADVWKIGQNVKADEFYDKSKKGYTFTTKGEGEDTKVKSSRIPFLGDEIFAANMLTATCNEMAKNYDQIIEDQNDYLVDIDTSLDEISGLEADLEVKIKQLEKEIEELLKKKEDGTITEEEEAELVSKNGEINNLTSQTEAMITAKNAELTKTTEKAGETDRKAKSEIAKNYGETALEKGQPLSETKDKKKTFWRKLFGGWNKQAERDAGKKLLEAGNGLLEQVSTSSEIDNKIAKKTKNLYKI